MRQAVTAERIRQLLDRFGKVQGAKGRIYLNGGATAVLLGWRESTIDVDLRLEAGVEAALRQTTALKEELKINIELASPLDFIPALPDWEARSIFIERIGEIDFYHLDLYSQLLAKIERSHSQDQIDIGAMLGRKLVDAKLALQLFEQIESELYRFPAIDAKAFQEKVIATLKPFLG